MIGPDEIARLSRMATAAGLTEVELNDGEDTLRLRFAMQRPQPAAAAGSAAAAPLAPKEVAGARSPGVGLSRHRHPVTGRPACETGQAVVKGQVVGYVEAGPCLRPATASHAGIVGAPACDEGTLVGYGTLLYPIE